MTGLSYGTAKLALWSPSGVPMSSYGVHTCVALNGTLQALTLGLPILGGLVADRYSYRMAFWIVFVVLTGAALLSTRLKRVRNLAQP